MGPPRISIDAQAHQPPIDITAQCTIFFRSLTHYFALGLGRFAGSTTVGFGAAAAATSNSPGESREAGLSASGFLAAVTPAGVGTVCMVTVLTGFWSQAALDRGTFHYRGRSAAWTSAASSSAPDRSRRAGVVEERPIPQVAGAWAGRTSGRHPFRRERIVFGFDQGLRWVVSTGMGVDR